jgi:hypothetical protein
MATKAYMQYVREDIENEPNIPDTPMNTYCCPWCDEVLDEYDYIYNYGSAVVGCEHCIEKQEAWDFVRGYGDEELQKSKL